MLATTLSLTVFVVSFILGIAVDVVLSTISFCSFGSEGRMAKPGFVSCIAADVESIVGCIVSATVSFTPSAEAMMATPAPFALSLMLLTELSSLSLLAASKVLVVSVSVSDEPVRLGIFISGAPGSFMLTTSCR